MSSTCFEHTRLLTRLLIALHVKHTIPELHNNRLPEHELSGSKHLEDIKIKTKILI